MRRPSRRTLLFAIVPVLAIAAVATSHWWPARATGPAVRNVAAPNVLARQVAQFDPLISRISLMATGSDESTAEGRQQ